MVIIIIIILIYINILINFSLLQTQYISIKCNFMGNMCFYLKYHQQRTPKHQIRLLQLKLYKNWVIMASQIKIQPWNDEIEEDIGYVKKLNTLSNFSSRSTSQKISNKKKHVEQKTVAKLKNADKITSAQTTLQNFNKTNRSEYKHRITKLVFSEGVNKKYKFQPQTQPERRPLRMLSSYKFFKPSLQHLNKSRQQSLKVSKKLIYYNLTELSSPMNSASKQKHKCFTEETDDNISKIKILQKIRNEKAKKLESLPVFRELSIERKVYILQSGNRSQKYLQKQSIMCSNKNKRSKNMITQICKAEKQYERERKNNNY